MNYNMAKDPIQLYKKREAEDEKRLGRKLDVDERADLMDDVMFNILDKTKIPDEEISDLEITGLKD